MYDASQVSFFTQSRMDFFSFYIDFWLIWNMENKQNLLQHIDKLQNEDRKFLDSNFFSLCMAFKKGRYWQKNYTSTTYYFLALRKTTIKDKYMTNEVTIFFRETIRSTFDDTEKAKQQQHGLFKGQRYLSYWYKVSCHNKGKSIKYEPWVIKKSTVYMSNRNEIFISKINREKSWYFFFCF